MRTTETEVYVASPPNKKLLEERMRILEQLWTSGLKAEMSYKAKPKLLDQFQHCEDKGIPLMVITGEDEQAKGVVNLRNVLTREQVNTWQRVAI